MEQNSREYSPQDETSLPYQHGLKTQQFLTKEEDNSFFVCNLDEVVPRHELWQKLLPRVEPHYAVKCNNDPVVLQLLNQIEGGFDCASKKNDDPFFVVNLDEVVSRHEMWQKFLPRIEPHYAVKCNNDPKVLQLLSLLGIGFDCASKSEIEQILQLGISPTRIIYANPCKQISYLEYAKQNNIDLTTFDNEYELYKVKEVYPDVRLLLRILPPDETKSRIPLGSKFGCYPKNAAKLFALAQKLGLNVVGVSFHVGSACFDGNAYVEAVVMAKEIFNVGMAEGCHLNILDIGGGFPGIKSDGITMEEICKLLVPALDKNFPQSSGVRIIAEPGRFYVTTAFTLFVTVIGKRMSNDNNYLSGIEDQSHSCFSGGETTVMYYLNDGMYGSFHDDYVLQNMQQEDRTPLIINSQQYYKKPVYRSSLWGPTCCSLDCVIKELYLPELSIGDWLLFRNMGAYKMAVSTNFNNMSRPHVLYVGDKIEKLAILKQAHGDDTVRTFNSIN